MALLDLITLQGGARPRPVVSAPRPAPVWETKAADAAPGPVAVVPVGQAGRPAGWDVDPVLLQRAYLNNPVAFACVQIRADAARAAPLLVERRTGPDTWATVPDHPLGALWAWPTAQDDAASFHARLSVALDTTGAWYAVKQPGAYGGVSSLQVLDPARVSPVPGPDGAPVEYQYRNGAGVQHIPADRMLARWLPHPSEPWRAISPLAVALGVVDADNGATDYVRNFYNNGGIISGVLKMQGKVDQAQADDIRWRWLRQFARRFGGQQHSVAVMDERAEYVPMGAKLGELDNEFLRSMDESRIHMVFGVPPLITYAYIGLLRSTYSNLPAAYQGFWSHTMTGWYAGQAQWLTRALLPAFEPESKIRLGLIRCRFDLSLIAALQENTDGLHERAMHAVSAGFWTVNDAREVTGRDPDPTGGDYYLRPALISAVKANADPTPPPPPEPPPPVAPAPGDVVDQAAALVQATQGRRPKGEQP